MNKVLELLALFLAQNRKKKKPETVRSGRRAVMYDINEALTNPSLFLPLCCSSGKVLVHCIMGMSRSSTLVLAYLMIYHRLPLKQALQKLIQKRAIYPNRNFLALLLDLDLQLTKKKKKSCQILWSGGVYSSRPKQLCGFLAQHYQAVCWPGAPNGDISAENPQWWSAAEQMTELCWDLV